MYHSSCSSLESVHLDDHHHLGESLPYRLTTNAIKDFHFSPRTVSDPFFGSQTSFDKDGKHVKESLHQKTFSVTACDKPGKVDKKLCQDETDPSTHRLVGKLSNIFTKNRKKSSHRMEGGREVNKFEENNGRESLKKNSSCNDLGSRGYLRSESTPTQNSQQSAWTPRDIIQRSKTSTFSSVESMKSSSSVEKGGGVKERLTKLKEKYNRRSDFGENSLNNSLNYCITEVTEFHEDVLHENQKELEKKAGSVFKDLRKKMGRRSHSVTAISRFKTPPSSDLDDDPVDNNSKSSRRTKKRWFSKFSSRRRKNARGSLGKEEASSDSDTHGDQCEEEREPVVLAPVPVSPDEWRNLSRHKAHLVNGQGLQDRTPLEHLKGKSQIAKGSSNTFTGRHLPEQPSTRHTSVNEKDQSLGGSKRNISKESTNWTATNNINSSKYEETSADEKNVMSFELPDRSHWKPHSYNSKLFNDYIDEIIPMDWLINLLSDEMTRTQFLLLDTRDYATYTSRRLVNARHVSDFSSDDNGFNAEAFQIYKFVLVYRGKSSVQKQELVFSSCFDFIVNEVKIPVYKVILSFEQIEQNYPFLCQTKGSMKWMLPTCTGKETILFYPTVDQPVKGVFHKLQLTHMISIDYDVTNQIPPNCNYHNITITKSSKLPLSFLLSQLFRFLQQFPHSSSTSHSCHTPSRKSHKILFISTSHATVVYTCVIGCLMVSHRWKLTDAYLHVRLRRPSLELNDEDVECLQDLEKRMFNKIMTARLPRVSRKMHFYYNKLLQQPLPDHQEESLPMPKLSLNQRGSKSNDFVTENDTASSRKEKQQRDTFYDRDLSLQDSGTLKSPSGLVKNDAKQMFPQESSSEANLRKSQRKKRKDISKA